MNYHDYNDSVGRARRESIANYHAERARMQAAFAEYDLGAVTLFMPRQALKLRLDEAFRMIYAQVPL